MENQYTVKKHWLKYAMTLYTVALMCIFFVIVGANDAIAKGSKTALASVDWLNLFGIMTASFFGLAMFENNGKLTGFWGLVSAIFTVVVFWQIKVWTLFVLYVYNVITNTYLTLNGGNEEKQAEVKATIIQLSIVFICGLIVQWWFEWRLHGFGIKLVDILSVLAFLLTGIGQTLLIKQTRWQFAAWVPKNAIELFVGILSGNNPVVIARNIYFLFMNVFSLSNWILTEKENAFNEELEANQEKK